MSNQQEQLQQEQLQQEHIAARALAAITLAERALAARAIAELSVQGLLKVHISCHTSTEPPCAEAGGTVLAGVSDEAPA